MGLIEKYPLPWTVYKMAYPCIYSSDNQRIMWGNDPEVLEFVVYLANKEFNNIPLSVVEDILKSQTE